MRNPKILIVGEGLSGKDTLSKIIEKKLGFKFRGSSEVANTEVVYPLLSNFYSSPEECFEDRRNNRILWRELICAFNRNDKSRLAKLVTEGGFGYTGLRDYAEVLDCLRKGVFTHVIWIERPKITEKDESIDFGFEELKNLWRGGLIKNLLYLENSTIEGLELSVKNEIKDFLLKSRPAKSDIIIVKSKEEEL